MPSPCCSPNCSSAVDEPQRQTFPLPKNNPVLYRKWINAIGIGDITLKRRERICLNHFLPKDLEKFHRVNGKLSCIPLFKYKLNPDAVPSVFPGKSHSPIREHNKNIGINEFPFTPNLPSSELQMDFLPEHDPIGLSTDDLNVCQICETSEKLIDISVDCKSHYRDEVQKLRMSQNIEFDVMFKFICNQCGDKLMDISIFRSQCAITHKKLMERITIVERKHPEIKEDNDDPVHSDFEEPKNEDEEHNLPLSSVNDVFENKEIIEDDDLRMKMQKSKSNPEIFSKHPNLRSIVRNLDPEVICKIAKTMEKATKNHKYISVDLKGSGFCCLICDTVMKNKYDLGIHQMKHKVKQTKCTTCGENFSTPTSLQRHIKIVHEKRKDFECGYCSRKFTHLFEVRDHMKVHQGYQYKCDICSKSFKWKYYLKNHNISHIPEAERTEKMRNFLKRRRDNLQRFHRKESICPTCGKIFKNQGNFKTHLRIHDAQKRHKCTICEKRFRETNALKSHMRTHTGEKPHKCEICSRSFRQLGHLRIHMQSHTGEKPFKCQICQKDFVSNGNLTAHMLIHTGDQPLACKMCDEKFARHKNLRDHYRLIHFPEYRLPTAADIKKKLTEIFGEI